MNFLKTLHIKLYYFFWNILLPKRKVLISEKKETKLTLFIYFDYEREFGGHNTSVSDKDIEYILSLLEKFNLKSTWFTVGKIFGAYPKSIQSIIEKGHEIGSHTFNHIPPLQSSKSLLKKDFVEFNQKTPEGITIKGYHAPNGQWSYKMLSLLNKYGYIYDVVGCKKNQSCSSHLLKYSPYKNTIRFISLGDDWPVFKKNDTQDQVLKHFVNLTQKLKPGEIAGVGFHPWVLFSDHRILKGFESFLEYVTNNSDIQINSTENYLKQLNIK